jgi:hypothetical protein
LGLGVGVVGRRGGTLSSPTLLSLRLPPYFLVPPRIPIRLPFLLPLLPPL